MVGPAVKREGVAHLRATMGLSERRACSIVSADRKMVRYRSCRPPDTELRTQLRDLANERKRFGYRRLSVLLRQEGEPSGINRIYRLYREEGLTVRKRRARRRAVGSRAPILIVSKPNARWSVDFVHDQLACGRRLRILNIVDDVTRECLAAIPDTSISGRRVARELTALIKRRGKPGMTSRTMGPSSPRTRCSPGRKTTGSSGISLRQESRCRMASARVSTGACATSFSTRACSSASIMPGPRSRTGSTITTSDGRTRRWAISHRWPMPPISPQHAIVCATPTICGQPLGKLFLRRRLFGDCGHMSGLSMRGRSPLAMMLSASSGFSSAPRARSAGRGTECPGRRFAGSPSPHCALAKLRRRLRRDALINRWTAPRAGTVRRSSSPRRCAPTCWRAPQ